MTYRFIAVSTWIVKPSRAQVAARRSRGSRRRLADAMIGGMLRVLRKRLRRRAQAKKGENDRREGSVRSRETTGSREGLVEGAREEEEEKNC